MKKIALIAAAVFCGLVLHAQDIADGEEGVEDKEAASQSFSERYDILVSKLGLDGVGVETLLTNWEKVDPDNRKLLSAWYGFYINKAQKVSVVEKPGKKYLGSDPVLTLKDSLGNDVNYFQQTEYDDSLFAIALKYLDKVISLYPKDLDYRFARCNSLLSFEGESPDMALADVQSLVDMYYGNPSGWVYDDETIDKDFFVSAVQEYCYAFYTLGTKSGYRAFKTLSEKMLALEKDDINFLANIGTYYLIAEDNYKLALKYYNKVLKIQPDDYTAAKNCVLISRRQKNTKLEKKYLAILIEATPDEAERLSSEKRLESL